MPDGQAAPRPACRPSALAIAVVAAVAPLLVVAIGQLRFVGDRAVPVGDEAVLELNLRSALSGHQLLGPWSRYGDVGGWFHPGPLMYYLFAPLYWLGGRRHGVLAVGALLLAAASVAAIVVMIAARYGRAAALAASGVLLVYEWRFGLDQLRSPWNPLIVILPLVVVIVAAQTITAPSGRWLPMVAVFAGSVATQSHLGAAPVVGAMLVYAIVASTRSRRAFVHQWGPAVALGFLLWSPPLYQQLRRGRAGNLALIVKWFVRVGPRGDRGQTPALIVRTLLLQPAHLGRWYGPEGSWNVMPGTTWTAWLTAALGCAAFAAVVAVGRRRSVAAWRRLAAPAVAVVVGIVALYRTTDPPAPYLATPLIAAGLSVWIVLATTLADLVVGGEASRLDRWRPLLPPLAAVAALAPLLASPAITTEAFRSFASSERVSTQAMASINASLVPMCAGRTASVRVALDGAAWSAALGAGVALQRCGKSVQFTPDLRPLVGDRYTNGAKVPALTVLFGCVDAPMPANAQLLTTVKGISADEIADVSVVPSADVDADSLTVHACPS